MNKMSIPKNPENKDYHLEGKINFQGFVVFIENWKGSLRKGKDKSGKEWQTLMSNSYGYISNGNVEAADKDHIDVFVGDNPESEIVFIVEQNKHDGSFDEHKIMLGFNNTKEAKEAYFSNYNTKKYFRDIKKMTICEFKDKIGFDKKELTKINEHTFEKALLFIDLEKSHVKMHQSKSKNGKLFQVKDYVNKVAKENGYEIERYDNNGKEGGHHIAGGNKIALSKYNKGTTSFYLKGVSPDKENNHVLNLDTDLGIFWHEVGHKKFSNNPELGHKILNELKEYKKTEDFGHPTGYSVIAENLFDATMMDFYAFYKIAPEKLKQSQPKAYEIMDEWEKRDKKNITAGEVEDVIHEYFQHDIHPDKRTVDEGWYSSGGCYDFAEALGNFIKSKGGKIQYWSYGSKEEPEVHVAVEYDGKFFDSTLNTKSLNDISNNLDFDISAKCEWTKTNKVPSKEKEVQKIENSFNDIFRKKDGNMDIEKANKKAHQKISKKGKIFRVKADKNQTDLFDKESESKIEKINSNLSSVNNAISKLEKEKENWKKKEVLELQEKLKVAWQNRRNNWDMYIGNKGSVTNKKEYDKWDEEVLRLQSEIKKELQKSLEDNMELFIDLEKAHVKQHTKKTKTGKLVNVKEHEDRRTKKENVGNPWIKKYGHLKLTRFPDKNVDPKDVKVDLKGDIHSHAVLVWKDPKTNNLIHAYTSERMQNKKKEKFKRVDILDDAKIEILKNKAIKNLKNKNVKIAESSAALFVIIETGLRVGSHRLLEQTGNKGVVTASPKDFKVVGDVINIDFKGKSYVDNTGSFENKIIANYIKKLQKENRDSKFLFSNIDHVNVGLRIKKFLNNKKLKTKDLRTYVGSQTAENILMKEKIGKLPEKKGEQKKFVKQKLNEALEQVAKKLNNTKGVARGSYVNPKIIDKWFKANKIDRSLYKSEVDEVCKAKKIVFNVEEVIDEHEKLTKVLKNKDPKKLDEEYTEQKKELKSYKEKKKSKKKTVQENSDMEKSEDPKDMKKKKIKKVMHEFKEGKLRSGSKHGEQVTDRKQAVAIALSEAKRLKKASNEELKFFVDLEKSHVHGHLRKTKSGKIATVKQYENKKFKTEKEYREIKNEVNSQETVRGIKRNGLSEELFNNKKIQESEKIGFFKTPMSESDYHVKLAEKKLRDNGLTTDEIASVMVDPIIGEKLGSALTFSSFGEDCREKIIKPYLEKEIKELEDSLDKVDNMPYGTINRDKLKNYLIMELKRFKSKQEKINEKEEKKETSEERKNFNNKNWFKESQKRLKKEALRKKKMERKLNMVNKSGEDEIGLFINLEKSHVKGHVRKTKSGKIVNVKDYSDSRMRRFAKEQGLDPEHSDTIEAFKKTRSHLESKTYKFHENRKDLAFLQSIDSKHKVDVEKTKIDGIDVYSYATLQYEGIDAYDINFLSLRNNFKADKLKRKYSAVADDGEPMNGSPQSFDTREDALKNVKEYLGVEKSNQDEIGLFINLEKAHVKQYERKTKTGKLVNVKEHKDKRQKKLNALKSGDKVRLMNGEKGMIHELDGNEFRFDPYNKKQKSYYTSKDKIKSVIKEKIDSTFNEKEHEGKRNRKDEMNTGEERLSPKILKTRIEHCKIDIEDLRDQYKDLKNRNISKEDEEYKKKKIKDDISHWKSEIKRYEAKLNSIKKSQEDELEKSNVKAHEAHSKTGKVIQVQQYQNKKTKKQMENEKKKKSVEPKEKSRFKTKQEYDKLNNKDKDKVDQQNQQKENESPIAPLDKEKQHLEFMLKKYPDLVNAEKLNARMKEIVEAKRKIEDILMEVTNGSLKEEEGDRGKDYLKRNDPNEKKKTEKEREEFQAKKKEDEEKTKSKKTIQDEESGLKIHINHPEKKQDGEYKRKDINKFKEGEEVTVGTKKIKGKIVSFGKDKTDEGNEYREGAVIKTEDGKEEWYNIKDFDKVKNDSKGNDFDSSENPGDKEKKEKTGVNKVEPRNQSRNVSDTEKETKKKYEDEDEERDWNRKHHPYKDDN